MRTTGLVRRLLALATPLIALMLAGCYETDVALVDHGDSADIAGKHACTLLIDDGGPFELTITEQARAAYRFTAPDMTGTVKLKKLDGGRYLLQLADDQYPGIWYYAYGEPTGASGFRALYPKRDNKALSATAIKTYAVRFFDVMDREDLTGATVKASPEALTRFLADPAMHQLAPWFTCMAK